MPALVLDRPFRISNELKTIISFPARWVSSESFERAIAVAPAPHAKGVFEVVFVLPVDCKVMVAAGAKLLSIANQLAFSTKRVTLDFEEGESGTMGYLSRMGFFNSLDDRVTVKPGRPTISGADIFRGSNPNLVEFEALRPGEIDKRLPSRMADALIESVSGKSESERERLHDTAFTIFAELIQNVYRHSETPLSGYAAMQLYRQGGKATVCVSDSGLGIMETLKRTLSKHYPSLAKKSDPAVLLEMVQTGVSRFGRDNGCGIRQSARKALAYNASMEIRMPTSRVLLTPAPKTGALGIAEYVEELPLIWGTHISFDFQLD